jgi:pimeloyl-ACP methyl ester carboxylesterase
MSERDERAGIYRSAAGARAVERRYLELLDRWPVAGQRLLVPTREGETFVVASGPGDAPPVLALQGSGANTAMWLGQIGAWARHLRVYAVDVIGEPGLSAPSRPPMASEAYALWLDDVMRELGLTHTSMVGVSLGGWLALDYATRRPERVTRLALLNPSGVGRRKVGVLLAAGLLRPFGDWGRRETLKLAVGGTSRAPAGRGTPLADFALLIFKHLKPRLQPIPVFDDDALRRLTMPVLAVVGGRDAMLDAHQTKRRLEAAVPHATARLLPEAGHLLPDQTATILDFLHSPNPGRWPRSAGQLGGQHVDRPDVRR